MDSPEVKAVKDNTRALHENTTWLKKQIRAIEDDVKATDLLAKAIREMSATKIYTQVTTPPEIVGDVKFEEPPGVKRIPVYGPSYSDIPLDERVSNGYGTITDDGIQIQLPSDLYTERLRDIVTKGGVIGFEVSVIHTPAVRHE